MKENLESALKNFKQAVEEARGNPIILHLDEYEEYIAGNIEKGNLEDAKYHAELLLTYYLGQNPYTPDQDVKMESSKEKDPILYQMMDAAKKMYKVGKTLEKLLKYI